MPEKIIDFSIKNKLIVFLFTLSIAAFGIFAVFKIPVGAVPDITNNQVQVITTSGNLSTQEIEQYITAPVEMEMVNLPGGDGDGQPARCGRDQQLGYANR